MWKWALAFFLFAGVATATPALAYTSPGQPTGYVNDFAHVLSTDTKQSLEQELTVFEATTTSEIAVAIVPSMDGDYIENYAVKLFEDWKIGKAKEDNGVLLVLSIEERKMRIEVGYGLEGALPDSLAQSILDNAMTPLLKRQDYDGAVTAGVHAIEAATQGEYSAPAETSFGDSGSWIFQNVWLVVIGIVFVIQWLTSILGRSKSWWAGGILGALAGLSLGWFVALSLAVSVIIAIFFAIFGLIFDFIVSSTYRANVGRGVTPPWWIGGGGFGGSSGSGGFGSFGGGGSGGGGASGGW